MFQAVYIPELSDYKDVVLFSVKSRRPDCDILAGLQKQKSKTKDKNQKNEENK